MLIPVSAQAHDEQALIDAIERVQSAAVKIIVTRDNRRQSQADEETREITKSFRKNFPQIFTQNSRTRKIGAGLLLDKAGVIVSSAHLIRGALAIEVELVTGEIYPARSIGFDSNSDLALIQITLDQPMMLPRIAAFDSIRVGQSVFAIGAPFGFAHSVTSGIVSAIRTKNDFLKSTAVIQTDVAVNPGNSGGPLFNYEGEVIGITTQILSTNGGFQGVSFAVPMDNVLSLVKQIQTNAQPGIIENR